MYQVFVKEAVGTETSVYPVAESKDRFRAMTFFNHIRRATGPSRDIIELIFSEPTQMYALRRDRNNRWADKVVEIGSNEFTTRYRA